MLRTCFDKPTGAAIRRRDIHRAADFGGTDLHVAQQQNLAFLARGQRAGFSHTGVVNGAAGQIARCLSSEINQTAIRTDRATLHNAGVECTDFHFDLDGAAHVQPHRAASTHQHIRFRGSDAAGIINASRYQGYIAATAYSNVPFVLDTRRAVSAKAVVISHKVIGTELQCRCHQCAHIDLCRGREQHAIGVHQEDLTIGVQSALNYRHISAQHAVERHGRS